MAGRTGMNRYRWAIAGGLLSLAMLSGCATPPEDPDELASFEEANDPLEDFNRYIHEVNYAFDQLVFRPLAGMYRLAVPSLVRDSFRDFLDNLRGPVIFVNDLLQGEGERAGITLARFLTNSTLGLGGFIDTADLLFDLKFHDEDFGQTLALWGVGEGFYLVLPLFGPSNPRDAVGLAVDSFLDPWNSLLTAADIEYGPAARSIVNGLDLRARNIDTLDDIERTSIDYYATLRSLYRQRRADQIRNGIPSANQPAPAIRGGDEGNLQQPLPGAPQLSLSAEAADAYATSPMFDEAVDSAPATGAASGGVVSGAGRTLGLIGRTGTRTIATSPYASSPLFDDPEPEAAPVVRAAPAVQSEAVVQAPAGMSTALIALPPRPTRSIVTRTVTPSAASTGVSPYAASPIFEKKAQAVAKRQKHTLRALPPRLQSAEVPR